MATSDPVTNFLARFGLRDAGHFVTPYVAAVVPLLVWTSASTLKASLFAAIPALAAVVFRQVFPHSTASATEVQSAVSQVESVLGKVRGSAAVSSGPVAGTPAPAPVQSAG